MSATSSRPFAIVTGASTGIGHELAKHCAEKGIDLLICADESAIEQAAASFRSMGVLVEAVNADLATVAGVESLWAMVGRRPVDYLFANAGRGLGGAFLDQNFEEARRVVDTNITGTIYLIQKVGQQMRTRRSGRILITGSVAGFMPGPFSAIYNGTKAFLNSFSFALRSELKDSGVTVTCLMPGATDTEFFKRADMLDTKVGHEEKDDPTEVAKVGFDAMMRGDGDIVYGWRNKLQTAAANVMPSAMAAERYRKEAEPESAKK